MLFKFNPFLAPKAWKFKDPDTGRDYKGTSLADLCTKIRGYREQNNLQPLEFLEATIVNYLCMLPENIGGCRPAEPLKRGIIQTFKGGIALLKDIAYKTFVSQEVADARAKICAGCPLNVFPDKGEFVHWADVIAEASLGKKRSAYHDQLGNCEACTCLMRSKVFYGGEITLTDDEKFKMKKANPNCWQLAAAKGNS